MDPFTSAGLYLVLELVRGCELFQLVSERGALDEPLSCRLIGQLVMALAALHRLGIVHRDVVCLSARISDARERHLDLKYDMLRIH